MNRIGPSNARQPGSPPLVVIVDPDESFGMLLQHFLERRGYHAHRLMDARYALRLLGELQADLLITSLDGEEIEVMELLMGMAVQPEPPPVLLCTRHSSTSPAMLVVARSLGVSQLLQRPCRFERILDAVQGLLAKSTATCAATTHAVGAVS